MKGTMNQGLVFLRRSSTVIALISGLALPSAALAAAEVNGSVRQVSINAQNSSLKEILSALGKQFDLQVQSTANLDKQVNGIYEGSLQRVMTRLLEGYNFIITSNEGHIQVTIMGTQAPQIIGSASPTPAANTAANVTQPAAGTQPLPVAPGTNDSAEKVSPSPTLLPPFKVAEGGLTPSGSPVAGPVPGPATSSLPQPTPPAGGSATLPMPTPSTASANEPELPMPTGAQPFPMKPSPSSSLAPAAPTASAPPAAAGESKP